MVFKVNGVEIKLEGVFKGYIVWVMGWCGLFEFLKEIECLIGNGVKG